MEEYKLDRNDEDILLDIEDDGLIDIIRKLNPNQYIILSNNGYIKGYNSLIDRLKKEGLDIGRGNYQYGWKMPLVNKKIEFRIFRRH